MNTNSAPVPDSSIYYSSVYWNNLQEVIEYMSKNFTGKKNLWWTEHFKNYYAIIPFQNALFLNCGDGRWDREFIDKKIAKKITAFDASKELIREAVKNRGNRNINYFIADSNRILLRKNEYDLVVNIAALHHVQYINRLLKIVCSSLKENGLLLSYDYTGPHRNQYSRKHWKLINKINDKLPNNIKNDELHYPHIPTMLKTDPTEAIHSELIIETIKKYFNIVRYRNTGGGIAYMLLTHNVKTNKLHNKKRFIKKILDYDRSLTLQGIIPPLFTYIIAKPNKSVLKNNKFISKEQELENIRENIASKLHYTYRLIDYFKLIKTYPNRFELAHKFISNLPVCLNYVIKKKLYEIIN